MSWVFDHHFFHVSNLSRPLIYRLLSIFEFGFDVAEIFYHKVRKNRLRGVHDTAWSQNFRFSKPTFNNSNIFFHDIDAFTTKKDFS